MTFHFILTWRIYRTHHHHRGIAMGCYITMVKKRCDDIMGTNNFFNLLSTNYFTSLIICLNRIMWWPWSIGSSCFHYWKACCMLYILYIMDDWGCCRMYEKVHELVSFIFYFNKRISPASYGRYAFLTHDSHKTFEFNHDEISNPFNSISPQLEWFFHKINHSLGVH